MSEPELKPLDDNAGHRSRLRDRLIGQGGDALLDHELIEYLLALAIPRRDTKPLAKALLDYLHADMAHHAVERFRVLHLNTRNMLIRDEVMSQGSIDETAVYVREVIRRAIDFGSAAIILVHNHPSGDPSPSRADIEVTRNITEAGKRLGIALHDHIIIGTKGHVSLRAQGLI